jgi:hypothetical protein
VRHHKAHARPQFHQDEPARSIDPDIDDFYGATISEKLLTNAEQGGGLYFHEDMMRDFWSRAT